MRKDTYILITLLLAVNFWELRPILGILNRDVILGMTFLWGFYPYFQNFKGSGLVNYFSNTAKYKKKVYWIFIGVVVSMYSASAFWGQSITTTLVSQRFIYTFVLLNTLLYLQPSEEEIFRAIRCFSFITIIAWALIVIKPSLLLGDNVFELNGTDIGYNIKGPRLVLLYLYYEIFQLLKTFSTKRIATILSLFAFFILYQNRSFLLGLLIIIAYSTLKLRSKNKIAILFFIAVVSLGLIVYTEPIWSALLQQSADEVSNSDYNRWKALLYYFNDYSPNSFAYIFGNGMPSGGNSILGNLMWKNFERGIFASDLGMIGMWTTYGVIPLMVIYSVLITVLIKKMPLYLKFISFHILMVPTIFHFWANPGVFLFVLIFYLYAYNTEKQKNDAIDYSS